MSAAGWLAADACRVTPDLAAPPLPSLAMSDVPFAEQFEGDPHYHPGQDVGLIAHEHSGFGYHWHMLPGRPDRTPGAMNVKPPPRPNITCPRCQRTSHHPTDVAEGYCGACHDWTSPRPR